MIEINSIEWSKLKEEDIDTFLSSKDVDNDENFFFEFKQDEIRKEKLVKEISAFANTYGGYIFIGVSDNKKIQGCSQWNEERIVSVIRDSITPIPDFAIRKFDFAEGSIYVVRVEEGSRPPYITTMGSVFERVSSESVKITQSDKLNQLYSKSKDSISKTREKIELPLIEKELFPNSLCGYIDLGFDLKLSTPSNFQENFYKFNFDNVRTYLTTTNNKFSISRIGWTYLITIGETKRIDNNPVELPAGLNHFIEILADGSVRARILLFSACNKNEVVVDNAITVGLKDIYEDIYKIIFGDELIKKYVYARKYEKLTVLKQFKAEYVNRGDIFDQYNLEHSQKYGANHIVNCSRIPWNDYMTIDKRYFNKIGIPYDSKHLYSQLFEYQFFNLGFIDMLKIPSDEISDQQPFNESERTTKRQ